MKSKVQSPKSQGQQSLTEDHKKAMRLVRSGADVFGYSLARQLREVEAVAPELITITKPMCREYDGAEQLPYFGAILTTAERRFVRVPRVKGGAV